MELITDPLLILLDEPTSGLDSFSATKIVRLLRRLARREGMTVISTIHQPSSDAFQLFDKLILMMEGHIVYHGPAKEATAYFSEIGYPCPKYANPADFALKVL